MNLILPLSHSGLNWQPTLPPTFKGYLLPGSEVCSATGIFGYIVIHQYLHPKFCIRLYSAHLHQTFIFQLAQQPHCLRTFLSTDSPWKIQAHSSNAVTVEKNHAAVLHAITEPLTISLTQKRVALLQVDYTTEMISELAENIGPPPPQLSKAAVTISTSAARRDILSLIQSLLHCPFDPVIRSYLFPSKAAELLFHYYRLLTPAPQNTGVSDHELQLIAEAERIINADLSQHHPIHQLAQHFLISQPTFKRLFKIVKGMAPFEYLVTQRMNKAWSLLQSGSTIKQAAALTGYQYFSFIRAFKKFYHMHPSALSS